MERDKIEQKVNDVLTEVLGVDYNEIKDDAVLTDDLGVDSLDAVEILVELEDEFDIYIPDDKMYNTYINASYTVKDVYDKLEEMMK